MYISLSNLPGRIIAASIRCGAFVAPTTTTLLIFWKPSSSTSSCESACLCVSSTSRSLLFATASISSKNSTAGAFFLAIANMFDIDLSVSPGNADMRFEALTRKNPALMSLARARISIVFPVPGGPNKQQALGRFHVVCPAYAALLYRRYHGVVQLLFCRFVIAYFGKCAGEVLRLQVLECLAEFHAYVLLLYRERLHYVDVVELQYVQRAGRYREAHQRHDEREVRFRDEGYEYVEYRVAYADQAGPDSLEARPQRHCKHVYDERDAHQAGELDEIEQRLEGESGKHVVERLRQRVYRALAHECREGRGEAGKEVH